MDAAFVASREMLPGVALVFWTVARRRYASAVASTRFVTATPDPAFAAVTTLSSSESIDAASIATSEMSPPVAVRLASST